MEDRHGHSEPISGLPLPGQPPPQTGRGSAEPYRTERDAAFQDDVHGYVDAQDYFDDVEPRVDKEMQMLDMPMKPSEEWSEGGIQDEENYDLSEEPVTEEFPAEAFPYHLEPHSVADDDWEISEAGEFPPDPDTIRPDNV